MHGHGITGALWSPCRRAATVPRRRGAISITRRQVICGLAFGVALSPFDVEAASPGFGDLLNAIGETITQSAKVISAVTEQINKAVSDGIGTYDKIKLEVLKSTLESIQGQMSSVNGRKIANIDAL